MFEKFSELLHKLILANNLPLSDYSSTANVSIIADFVNLSNNIVTFKGITSDQLSQIQPNQRFGAYRADNKGPLIYSKITSVDAPSTSAGLLRPCQ